MHDNIVVPQPSAGDSNFVEFGMLQTSIQRIIILSLLIYAPLCDAHKIVYLISPPRSLSVAFMRMIQARGDFTIFHEPSQYAYCKNEDLTVIDSFNKNAPATYTSVKQHIFNAAESNNVFVKEMSFAVYKNLLQDQDLMHDPRVYFVFLLRNPHHTILSWYQRQRAMGFDPRLDLINYGECYDLFNYVYSHAKHRPLVILSEDLYTHSTQTIQSFCNHVDIPFLEEALSWKDLGAEFTGQQEWHEIKIPAVTHTWHADAIRSTGFRQPSHYDTDAHNNPTFTEIDNLEDRIMCKKAYEYNKKYYDLIKQKSKI